jgi:hypothetical protein
MLGIFRLYRPDNSVVQRHSELDGKPLRVPKIMENYFDIYTVIERLEGDFFKLLKLINVRDTMRPSENNDKVHDYRLLVQVMVKLYTLIKYYKYNHRDFHCGNVMYKNTEEEFILEYINEAGNKEIYDMSCNKELYIIDFGYSCFDANNEEFPKQVYQNFNLYEDNIGKNCCSISRDAGLFMYLLVYYEEGTDMYSKHLHEWAVRYYQTRAPKIYKLIKRHSGGHWHGAYFVYNDLEEDPRGYESELEELSPMNIVKSLIENLNELAEIQPSILDDKIEVRSAEDDYETPSRTRTYKVRSSSYKRTVKKKEI